MKIIGVDLTDLGTKNVLAAAAFYNVSYDFTLAKGGCCSSEGKKDEFSDVKPSVSVELSGGLGSFCGSISISRYLMEEHKKGSAPEELFARSDITSWMEFFYERLDVGSRCQAVTKVVHGDHSELAKCIRAIDAFLLTHTFLVGEALSLADVVCAITVDHLISISKLDTEYLANRLLNLSRLIRTVKESDVYAAYHKKVATLNSGVANESGFVIDTWKKTYSNCKGDLEKEVMPWLWDNFDSDNWNFYFMKYNKLDDECKSEITTSNMLSGFLQRFEPDFRRISFGVINVMGSDNSYDIMGVWLIKGKDLPPSVTEHPSFEFHTFSKLDVTNENDRKIITDYFCAEDSIGGVLIADAKVWK